MLFSTGAMAGYSRPSKDSVAGHSLIAYRYFSNGIAI